MVWKHEILQFTADVLHDKLMVIYEWMQGISQSGSRGGIASIIKSPH